MAASNSQHANKFVHVNVTFDSEDGMLTKVPTIAKMTECKHYKFFVNAESKFFAIDINREDSNQPGKKDGVDFFEKWCGPIEANDTLTIRTINKGYYKVYRRTPEIEGIIKSGPIHPLYLCNILSAKDEGVIFGEGYEIVKKMDPQNPPESIINLIINNISTTSLSIISQIINKVIGAHEIMWKIEECTERDAFILIPQTTECCVVTGYYHTCERESCLYVYKSSVVCYCYHHGKRLLIGSLSRSIRNIFFDIKCHRSIDKILPYQNDCKNVLYFAVSRNLYNKDKMYAKFGNYKLGYEKKRFSSYNTVNPSFDYATIRYNQKAFREFTGYSHEYLDNYINHKILLKKSNKPLVSFKNTDWFEISERAAKEVISYIKNRHEHTCNLTQVEVCEISTAEERIPLNNKYDFQIFLENICDYLNVVPVQKINTLLFLGAAGI